MALPASESAAEPRTESVAEPMEAVPQGAPCERASTGLAARIEDDLREAILSLALPPGHRLSENDAAARLGVSRTPTREALRQLDHEGLLERAGRYYVVRRVSADEIRQAYELLEGLETLAAALAAERADPAVLDRAEAALAAALAARERGAQGELRALIDRVHMLVAEASGNRLVTRQVALLRRKLRWQRAVGRLPLTVEAAAIRDQHRILGAIRRRAPDIAVAEARHHVRWLARQHGQAAEAPA